MFLLMPDICYILPISAYFQSGHPIYSAKSVRFRYGHPKTPEEFKNPKQFPFDKPADDKFVWTYTSPEFPMLQVIYLKVYIVFQMVLVVALIIFDLLPLRFY